MHIGYWWESQKKKRSLGRPRRRLVDNNVARRRLDKRVPSATNTHEFRVTNACSMDTKTELTQVAQQRLGN
jgi:hypothetical protein